MKAVSDRLNSRAMAWRVSVGGSWPAGMRTRASGLPLNFVWVLFEVLVVSVVIDRLGDVVCVCGEKVTCGPS